TFAFITARERYEAALAIMDAHPAVAGERGWVSYLLANTYFFGDPARALAIQSEVIEEHTGDDAALVALARYHRGLIELYTGRGGALVRPRAGTTGAGPDQSQVPDQAEGRAAPSGLRCGPARRDSGVARRAPRPR